MAIIINEQRMVDENTFLYEEKIKSPTSRFLDTTPTFVTYYHINDNVTTADDGFIDVADFIGKDSPLRFNKIEKFPLYAMEQIVLQMQDSEAGLDSSYEEDAIILPGTIKPLINDYFVIPVLKDAYVFRVINIVYDNVMPDNFYKIEFKLEYIDKEKLNQLDNQRVEEYVCVVENIGTETNCIIEKSEFNKIREIQKMYSNIVEFYKAMFYNSTHNVFLCDVGEFKKIYDPFQADFINKFNLFNEKNRLDVLILTNQFDDKKRMYKYSKSVYKFMELKDLRLINNFKYTLRPGIALHESSFYRWHDKTVEVIDIPPYPIPDASPHIFSDEFIYQVKYNDECNSEYATLIKRFLRNEELTVKDISLNLDQELLYLNDNLEVFFFTPILMYIIKMIIKKELEVLK